MITLTFRIRAIFAYVCMDCPFEIHNYKAVN